VALAGLSVVVATWGIASSCVTPEPTGGALRANLHRIATNGVSSQSELVSILGPPGDYTTAPTSITGFGESVSVPYDHLLGLPVDYWKTDTVEITILVTKDGCADLMLWTVNKSPQGTLENYVWRAKRQWRRWFP
jgi:hypothetical protein